jgi:uncharacterized membrane protein YphA (DoxX/SURF4 family)
MKQLGSAIATYWRDAWGAWDRFWFTPSDPATLSAIRLFAGAMLFYTHLVWSFDLSAFFGPDGWLPLELYWADKYDNFGNMNYRFSFFPWITSTWLLWLVHICALVTMFLFTIGLFTRTTAVLTAIFAINYLARVMPGAFYGLDKVTCMLAVYLMLGPCGARYSVDRLLRLRRGVNTKMEPRVMATVAVRLIQFHLCAIYLYSGLGKLEGFTWWTGEAIWLSIANLEYQSLDVSFLGNYPWLMNLLAFTTVFWELFYVFLIWPRFTRPWMLATAIGVHSFIALCMGMITFGLAMLIANLSFVSPETVRRFMDPIASRVSLAIVGEKVE